MKEKTASTWPETVVLTPREILVHTFHEQGRNRSHIRMISSRKATRKERKQYGEGAQ